MNPFERIMKKLPALPACLFLAGFLPGADLPVKPTAGGHLQGELSAEQILNGEYPWPPSPVVSTRQVGPDKGFDPDAFGMNAGRARLARGAAFESSDAALPRTPHSGAQEFSGACQ